MSKPLLLLGLGVGAALLLAKRQQQQSTFAPVDEMIGFQDDPGGGTIVDDDGFVITVPPLDVAAYLQNSDNNVALNDKIAAFLQMIRFSEHAMNDVMSGQDYYTVVGGGKFSNDSDHPANTGEWDGKPMSDDFCRRAGFGPGCKTYAAGAYQITKTTWNVLRKRAPRLPDFSPASQDEAALRLLREIGVPQLLNADRFEDAVYAASQKWASLPSSPLPGKTRSIAEVAQWYRNGLRMA